MDNSISDGSILVTSSEALDSYCRSWISAPVLALDTEFVRTRTFFAKLGLIQVADGERTVLIDTVATTDLEPFRRLLSQRRGETVLHSCSEDFAIFAHRFGTLPHSVFDTQIAAALLGYGFSTGYQALVRDVLGIEIGKDETRSNWLRRPLTEAQLRYAAADVRHLYRLHRALLGELELKNRQRWVSEECARLLDTDRYSVEPGEAYRRIKGHGRLRDRQLAVLRQLCEWREEEAVRRDLARNFVIHDRTLLDIAKQLPSDLEDLRQIESLDRRTAQRYGQTLLTRVRSALEAPLPPSDSRPKRGRISGHKETLRSMQELVARKGRETGIAPEVLAQKRVLDSLLRRFLADRKRTLPTELEGWRRDVVGEALLELLDGLEPGVKLA